jgi:uncharacterized protein
MSEKGLKLIIRITDRCNLNCTYCYVDSETRRTSRVKIGIESFARLYAEVLSGHFGYVTIVWHGGEPTLVGADYLEQVIALQAKYKAGGVVVRNSIQTNTTAVTPRMIEVFKRYDIGVGVSIDAPADIHSQMRVSWDGHSSLSKVMDQIALMRQYGLSFGAICVLHKNNYRRADEIYDFFKVLQMSYHFNPFYRDEATPADVTTDLSITPEQYAEAMLLTYDRYVSDPDHTIDVTDIKDIITSMMVGRSNNCLYAGQCQDFVGILPTGEMYLCDMFYREDQRVGHIDTFTVGSMTRARPVEIIKTRPLQLTRSYCTGCEWWSICRGGCSSKAAAVYGNAMREDPFCRTRKQLFAHIRDSLTQLGREGVNASADKGK